jgi:hypothetical protein
MLLRLACHMATEISPRLALKAGHLWVYKGMRAVAAYKRRTRRGELFPPFLFLALTARYTVFHPAATTAKMKAVR